MPEIEFRGDHVHVQLVAGQTLDAKDSDGIWATIAQLCEANGTKRVMVEGYVPGGDRDTSDVIAAGQRTARVPHLWMAFHLEDFEKTDASELFEAVAGAKGVRVKFFRDAEHALMWLRNNTPS